MTYNIATVNVLQKQFKYNLNNTFIIPLYYNDEKRI